MSPPSTRQVPDERQPSCNSPFKIAGSQKGGAFVSLPSCFRVRAGLSQEDEMSVYEAGNQESQHSAPGCGNKAISSCSSQEGESALAMEQLATGPGPQGKGQRRTRGAVSTSSAGSERDFLWVPGREEDAELPGVQPLWPSARWMRQPRTGKAAEQEHHVRARGPSVWGAN